MRGVTGFRSRKRSLIRSEDGVGGEKKAPTSIQCEDNMIPAFGGFDPVNTL
jgi:hypothetical protein